MRRLFTLGPIATLVLAGAATAFAQGAASKKPAPEPAKPPAAGAAAMPVPTPPAEMQQLKGMIGRWRCEGKFTAEGHEMPMKSRVTFKSDLDGFVVVGTLQSPKTKQAPKGYKGTVTYAWDAAGKQFVAASADNMGSLSHMTSKGWNGDMMEWTGKESMMGVSSDCKETITKTGPKQVTISGMSGPAGHEMKWEISCKK